MPLDFVKHPLDALITLHSFFQSRIAFFHRVELRGTVKKTWSGGVSLI
jgi:hypothetical protein